ncbi:auxin-responsive protein SAUR78-like [Papaver somniferum]|uniref:auxin-responsive protein SAUR78-like n=1 Tax=Papaver somniferum TaxID=3469 RepID=UPI000E6F6F4B|nr:auxin-responsive protein SAUR78-like [Papaver somniferum]
MAKGLTKLKSVMKKWQSFGKRSSNGSSIAHNSSLSSSISSSSSDDQHQMYMAQGEGDLHPVYVGKSRRRYLISSEIIENPLVKELVDRSSGSDSFTVGCEVVLFEHLLWMLQNADPQPESLDEFVDFYAC